MRWPTKLDTYWDWKPWFAWYPVLIGNTWVWLETIARKRERVQDLIIYEYGELE